MSLANGILLLSSSSCLLCGSFDHKSATNFPSQSSTEVSVLSFASQTNSSESRISRVCSWPCLRNLRFADGRWRLKAAADTRILDSAAPSRVTAVEIPVNCYQLIGVSDQAEKDEIVKSVMDLKRAEVEEGYTMDAVMSRQELLMDVRDKLLFEPEYAGNTKEKIPPKSPLRIPWAWLPGALCLLQEVGEEKLVLDIGRAALQNPDAKSYIHDMLLSMALAECAIAKIGFEKNKVSQGFESLARAQYLLRSKRSLGKMTLLSQIERYLEELAPACTLELLGMPHSPENTDRRRGAIAALHELLRQGLDVEKSCQVQDWACFLSQALNRLMATEIVNLLPWDTLAITRKNKKSLESQNQRVVIDFNCFYMVLIAHVALGFAGKQTELIEKAKLIGECLVASEGIDLKFEEAFCLFLLGQSALEPCVPYQGNEAEALEKLKQLELNSNSSTSNSMSVKESKVVSHPSPSLEIWLKDAVLAVFPDTRDCSPSLANFFRDEKKVPVSAKGRAAPEKSMVNQRALSSVASEGRDFKHSLPGVNSSRPVRSAVKQLTPTDLHTPLGPGKNSSGSNAGTPSVQLNRNLGSHHNKVCKNWPFQISIAKGITFVTVLGCTTLFSIKLSGLRFSWISVGASRKPSANTSSVMWKTEPSLDYKGGAACLKGSSFAGRIAKLLDLLKMQPGHLTDAGYLKTSSLPVSLSTSMEMKYKRHMPIEEAEDLVKRWQTIKAEALGPSHQVYSLSEALDEPMLVQWQSLADAAITRSCYWRFVILQLTILKAYIYSDGTDGEMAEIKALLEEAAELVDVSQPKNSNYYSTYKIHYILKKQDDGSWKFCQCDIERTQ